MVLLMVWMGEVFSVLRLVCELMNLHCNAHFLVICYTLVMLIDFCPRN